MSVFPLGILNELMSQHGGALPVPDPLLGVLRFLHFLWFCSFQGDPCFSHIPVAVEEFGSVNCAFAEFYGGPDVAYLQR